LHELLRVVAGQLVKERRRAAQAGVPLRDRVGIIDPRPQRGSDLAAREVRPLSVLRARRELVDLALRRFLICLRSPRAASRSGNARGLAEGGPRVSAAVPATPAARPAATACATPPTRSPRARRRARRTTRSTHSRAPHRAAPPSRAGTA